MGGYEAPVNPELWTNVASQIGSAATTGSVATGISTFTKWMLGLGISTVVVTTAVIVANSSDKEEPSKNLGLPPTGRVVENDATEENINFVPSQGTESNSEEAQENSGDIDTGFDRNGMEREHLVIPSIPYQEPTPPRVAPPEPLLNPAPSETGPAEANPAPPKEIVPPVAPEEKEQGYTIAQMVNTFTPNYDAANPYFTLEIDGLSEFSIVVLNQMSEVVFTSNDTEFVWDGTDSRTGDRVPAGNYLYYIIAQDRNGDPVKLMHQLIVNY